MEELNGGRNTSGTNNDEKLHCCTLLETYVMKYKLKEQVPFAVKN